MTLAGIEEVRVAGIEDPDPSTLADGSGDAVGYLDDYGLMRSDWPLGCVGTIDRVIVNFTLGMSNLRCPARCFTERDAALEWLQQGDHA